MVTVSLGVIITLSLLPPIISGGVPIATSRNECEEWQVKDMEEQVTFNMRICNPLFPCSPVRKRDTIVGV